MRRIHLVSLSCFFLSVSACSSAAGDESLADEGALEDGPSAPAETPVTVTPGDLRMYPAPNAMVMYDCDHFVRLNLTAAGKAMLRSDVDGFCDESVNPQTRRYDLTATKGDCGTKIYKGERTANGGTVSIVITDHRERTCGDSKPAKVIAIETGMAPKPIEHFSKDRW